MISRKFYLFTFLLLFGFLTAKSQTLYDNKTYGPYIALFKLDEKQAQYAVEHPYKLDTSFLYTNQVGELSADSVLPLIKAQKNGFPIKAINLEHPYRLRGRGNNLWNLSLNGYFIEVRVISTTQVSYRIIENPIFRPSVIRVGTETFVFVEDSAGLTVLNAKVKLDTSTCVYDPSIGGYKIPGINVSGTLFVQKGEIFSLNRVNGYSSSENNRATPRDNYHYSKLYTQGYLVTNKPVYKMGDTVFFKAFIVNKKAKPLKSKVIARMYQNSTGKGIELELNPNPRGAYNGHFVIGDSFQTDDELGIIILNTKRQSFQQQMVRLENYELKDIEFTTWVETDVVTPGAGNAVYVKTTNKAGLPMLDGSIKLTISLADIEYASSDSFAISMKKMREFYTVSMQTDPTGITKFELPANIFPDIKGTFSGLVTLLTADNETTNQYISFRYETTKDKQLANIESDTLYVSRLLNMLPVQRKMKVKLYSRYDLVKDTTITTPFKMYLPSNINMAAIYKGDTNTANLYRDIFIPEINGKRTHDSIYISFHSPKDVPVYYRVYKNNKIVLSGSDTVLQYSAFDKSKESYHLQYGVSAGHVSNPNFFSKSFHLAEKELQIEIKQPTTIFPGQQVPVEIWVKDAYGKPVNKVNLTAWAVNTQLDGVAKPNVPYMGKMKFQKPLSTHYFSVSNFEYSHYSYVHPWHFAALKLYENKVFELIYPKNGFTVLADTTPDHTTQIAFYNHSKGVFSPVKYAKLNNSLVFIDEVTPNPGLIKTEAGTYNLTARLADRIVTFKDIQIQKGMKNFICFNLDSLVKSGIGDTISYLKYSPAEMAELFNHTLFFKFDNWLSDTLVIQVNGSTSHGIIPNNGYPQLKNINTVKSQYNSTYQRHIYINSQSFYVYGPINNGDKITIFWKNKYSHEFTWQEGYSYSFTEKEMAQLPLDEINPGHAYFSQSGSNAVAYNTFWFDPLKKQDKSNEIPYQSQQSSKSALPEFNYSNYLPNKISILSNLNLFLPEGYLASKIWLFNIQDSSFSNLNNYPYVSVIQEAGLNAYKNINTYSGLENKADYLLALQHNDSLWIVKKLHIDSAMWLLMTFKSTEFRKLSKNELLGFDRMAKILSQQPFAFFEDTPTINKGMHMIHVPSKNGKTSLEGTVNGPNLKYVVANAFVILEKNGYFVRGAITNSDGRFFMDSLLPGDYMLKIKAQDYHFWIAYSIKLDKGKLQLISINMVPFSRYTVNELYAYEPEYMYDDFSMSSQANGTNYYATPMENIAGVATIKSRKNISSRIELMDKKKEQRNESRLYDSDGISDKLEKEDDASYLGGNMDYRAFKLDEKIPVSYKWNFGDISQADTTMLNAMAKNASAGKIRERFQDHAYWIPNLTTDKKGFASYSVQFPDNITTWQTWVPAMDGNRHSGVGELLVKAYKPVSSGLAIPYFLTEGDAIWIKGRINNYTGASLNGRYTLLEDSVGLNKTITVTGSYKDSIQVRAGKAGRTLWLENGFAMDNGYKDIQKREIRVLSSSVSYGTSAFTLLKSDTTIKFTGVKGDFAHQVIVYNEQLALLNDLLQSAEYRIYPDNQSLADYLHKLLVEKKVKNQLGIDFDKDELVKETIKKLRNAQLWDGSFSWFRNGKSDKYISSYAAEILFKANEMGYNNNAWLNTARYFEKQLSDLYEANALQALYSLKRMNRKVDYDTFLRRITFKTLNLTEKLKYQWLLSALGKKADIAVVVENLESSPKGYLNLKEDLGSMRIFNPCMDNSSNTYLAWELLYLNKARNDARTLMASYMANEAGPSLRTSVYAADMLIQENSENKTNDNLKPQLMLNGIPVPISDLPKTIHLLDTSNVQLSHKGAPIYVLENRMYKTYNPISDTNLFKPTLEILQGDTLLAGNYANIKLHVFAKSTQNNVVIEIPIPAGCVVASKIQNEHYFEAQREYDYNRVYIYLDHLPFGQHDFNLLLMSKFGGTFNLPPARVALMHYPDLSAYTEKKTITIR